MSENNHLDGQSAGRYTLRNKLLDMAYFFGRFHSLWKLARKTNSMRPCIEEVPQKVYGDIALADLFNKYGSDKSTHHDYHLLYEELLGNKRYEIKSIIEIGIGSIDLETPQNMGIDGHPGGSLRAFRDWAPRAQVFGADIDEKTLFEEERIHTYLINQLERESFALLKRKLPRDADLIVIDGLHTPRADMNSLLELLPKLKDGGCFVIEDISPRAAGLLWPFAIMLLRNKYSASIRKMKNGYVFVLISGIKRPDL